MGDIYTKYNFDLNLIKRNKTLVLICLNYEEFLKYNKIKDLTIINLGLDLSQVLKKYPPKLRLNNFLDELNNIFVKAKSDCILVKNIDILFNPEYKLNVLNYFINLSRNKLIFIEWPGQLKGRVIEYSEINYPDYRKYNIDDYKIALIK